MEKYGIELCWKNKEKNKHSCMFNSKGRSNLQIGVNRFKREKYLQLDNI